MKRDKQITFSLLILALFCYCTPMMAQNTGLLLEDETYNDESKVAELDFSSGSKFDELPLKASLRQYCPEIQNQGQIGSCVGWSSGYAAFTISYAVAEDITDKAEITKNAFSALYIYNQIKIGDCYQGSLFSNALKLLKNEGDVPHLAFDYPKDDCQRMPSVDIKAKANSTNYEVRDYFTLFRSTDDGDLKVRQVKKSIAEKKPVIVGFLIRENFKYLNKEDRYWDPDQGNTSNAGGHAMVIVGYDDGKGAFLLMNSWGKNWGRDGYMWVKYEDFGKFCVYGYQLLVAKSRQVASVTTTTTTDNPNNSGEVVNSAEANDVLSLSAEFVFKHVVPNDDWDSEEILFDEAEAEFNGAFYKLKRRDWELGQQFQLVSRKITKDRYIYVFSVDPDNIARVHWPRNEKYSQKFFQLNESPLVPYSKVEIIIPGKDRALILDKSGVDNLFVLYSDRRIDDLLERVEQIRDDSGEPINRLQRAFGERLIPLEDIEYDKTKMTFEANTTGEGYIAPIILQVER